MVTGTLKFFDGTKGWGFIAPDDRSRDVFVHITAVQKAGIEKLIEGGPIAYDIGTDPRTGKLCAVDLSIPSPNN